MDCYRFEEWKGRSQLKIPIVPVGYVLTLEPTIPRLVRQQLEQCSICEKLYVVHNTSFKACHKPRVHATNVDLAYSNQVIAQHAVQHHPQQNMVIFEDDFQWIFQNLNINIHKALRSIETFLASHPKVDHYSLGSFWVPFEIMPTVHRHVRLTYCASIAGVIHTCQGIRKILDMDVHAEDVQMDKVLSTRNIFYTYQYPLGSQLLNETENRKSWASWINMMLIRMFHMDTNIESIYRSNLFTLLLSVPIVNQVITGWFLSFAIQDEISHALQNAAPKKPSNL